VTMNYVHFSAYHYRSGQRASSCSTDVERDDHVFTDLARRSSIIKAGKKLSTCRFRSCSGLDRFSTGLIAATNVANADAKPRDAIILLTVLFISLVPFQFVSWFWAFFDLSS